eukprot:TRINITY_DN128344_c0_g1_i1.p1 TRINITY_DN128344_c0_g1~~TRINITY_DN128344_c0_g1_i1.p1  ORF type:complete len:141 (+),score=26.22 TRINITY_DN128344_c0_g1_i1:454-876(+)
MQAYGEELAKKGDPFCLARSAAKLAAYFKVHGKEFLTAEIIAHYNKTDVQWGNWSNKALYNAKNPKKDPKSSFAHGTDATVNAKKDKSRKIANDYFDAQARWRRMLTASRDSLVVRGPKLKKKKNKRTSIRKKDQQSEIY